MSKIPIHSNQDYYKVGGQQGRSGRLAEKAKSRFSQSRKRMARRFGAQAWQGIRPAGRPKRPAHPGPGEQGHEEAEPRIPANIPGPAEMAPPQHPERHRRQAQPHAEEKGGRARKQQRAAPPPKAEEERKAPPPKEQEQRAAAKQRRPPSPHGVQGTLRNMGEILVAVSDLARTSLAYGVMRAGKSLAHALEPEKYRPR